MARLALEALAAEGVRSGKLSVFQARELLGIQSRNEMGGFLKKHGVFLDLTLADVQQDSDAARLVAMTVVIADSSPLNNLTLIGSMDVLHRLYGTIIVPRQVIAELIDPAAPEGRSAGGFMDVDFGFT